MEDATVMLTDHLLIWCDEDTNVLSECGLIWWEANAVIEEGKANELQMMLTEQNKGAFSDLINNLKTMTVKKYNHTPVSILQLTHSGRYSRPRGDRGIPIIAQHDPILDRRMGIDSDYPLCSDEYLKDLVGLYVKSALLAQEVGFDGVDVKACHRYCVGAARFPYKKRRIRRHI